MKAVRWIALVLAIILCGAPAAPMTGARTPPRKDKPRVLILTDISSLTAGVREPDDGQSLIRFLLYANEFEVEGLVATSNIGHGQTVRPELIRQAVDAYEEVRPNLLLHDRDYPTTDHLRARIKAGQPVAGLKMPVFESIGEGKNTEASDWIIRVLKRSDRRPLWVLIWGGSADLAQALWKLRSSRPVAEVARLIGKLRVHAINDQDSTAAWIRETFPDLYYITRTFAIRGMYRSGDTSLVSREWVEENVRTGHGALGALYPNYNGGDIWSHRLGQVRGIKEGDTPSFLGLLPVGLADVQHPEWGSWGGRMQSSGPNRLVDALDDLPGSKDDPDPHMAAVYRWRPAYQADFQARLDWCVKPYADANHPPLAVLNGDRSVKALVRKVRPGSTIDLDASGSRDPDGNVLTYRWWVYADAGTYRGAVRLGPTGAATTKVHIPEDAGGKSIHVILEVRDSGAPSLTSYRRVILEVRPGQGSD
jgi:hypothetical protein